MTTMTLTERGTQLAVGVQVLDYLYVVPTDGIAPYHEFIVGNPYEPPAHHLHLVTRDDRLIRQGADAYVTAERQDVEWRHAVRKEDGKRLEQLVAIRRGV